MTLHCGSCGKEISSQMVEVRCGSHYSEHYEMEEEILHKDLGKVLKIEITKNLQDKLELLQKQSEPKNVSDAFRYIFVGDEQVPVSNWNRSIKDVKDLISSLERVIREVESYKIVVECGTINTTYLIQSTQFGRHQNFHWNRLHIPDVDICKNCFDKFFREEVTLSYLNEAVPGLKLDTVNKNIWDDIRYCNVKIELEG